MNVAVDNRAPVAARSSSFRFKGQDDALRRLGQELHVEAVLEGSVRKAGDRLRIAVQLVAVADASHLWSARYDLISGDVFAVEEEIAASVAPALGGVLARSEKDVPRPAETRMEAYEVYLRGRQYRLGFTYKF